MTTSLADIDTMATSNGSMTTTDDEMTTSGDEPTTETTGSTSAITSPSTTMTTSGAPKQFSTIVAVIGTSLFALVVHNF